MSNLLSENQSAYINNRFTSESSVLIFDVLEIRFSSNRLTFNDNRHRKII